MKSRPLKIPAQPVNGKKPARHIVERSTVNQLNRYVPPPRKPKK